jgi:hypothetical protein
MGEVPPWLWATCGDLFDIQYVDKKYALTDRRGKEYGAGMFWIPFLSVSNRAFYYTQIEAAAGLWYTVRLGFNPGELLDFLLGWTTIDILSDDVGM